MNHSVLIFGSKLKQSRVDALEDTSLGKLLKLKDVFDAMKLTVTSKLYPSRDEFWHANVRILGLDKRIMNL